MGLFTTVTLDEAHALGAEYGLDIRAVEPLQAGSVNSNFRVVDAAGNHFFARIYEEQAAAGAVVELRLLSELWRVDVPVTVPLQRRDGSWVASFRGKPYAMYPWVEGELLCRAMVTPAHCGAVGAALGKLHAATPWVTPLPAGRFRVEDLFARLDRVDRESPEHRADAARIRERLSHYVGLRNPDAPAGVVHGDLFRDNVFFRGESVLALIDFESASHGVFAFDVMVTALAWCYGAAFERDQVAAFFAGYEAARPFLPGERENLLVEGAIACLRFATTRITDFSMRAEPGKPPLRDYRRFLSRLDALEAGVLDELGLKDRP